MSLSTVPNTRDIHITFAQLVPHKVRHEPRRISEKERRRRAFCARRHDLYLPDAPQIRQLGPGTCPICGMALEPELVTLNAGPNPDLADMSRRFWIGLALAIPVFILEMAGHFSGLIAPRTSNWLQLILATPVVLWAGWPLTGDNRVTAQAVARKLGITQVEAEVLPQDKSRIVERLKGEGHVVAMAGDGVNDASALAAADVGIAMGTGTDVAIESAGITLVKGDLTGIVRARRLSQVTMGNIRQNLFFAFVYNAAGVPVAAGVLYPILGILLSPIIAAAAMALSSVSVIANALRLRAIEL